MNPVTDESPTEVEIENAETPNGATPSETSKPADDRERRLAILRGEIDPEESVDEPEKSQEQLDAETIIEQFDPETGEFIEPEAKPEPEESAETATLETEDDPDDETETETEPAEAEAGTAKEKRRIAIRRGRLNDRDFAIVQLADHEKISLADAERRLYGITAKDAPATEVQEQTETGPTVESIGAEIEALKIQRTAAEAGLDLKKGHELSDQIHELKLQQHELLNAQKAADRAADREKTQTAEQAFAGAQQSSIEKAAKMYPDLANRKSALALAVESEIQARCKSDPAFFERANWAVLLAVELATEKGIAPSMAKPAASKPTPAQVLPKKQARPAPPNPAPGTASGATQPTNEAALLVELDKATKKNDLEGIRAVRRQLEALPR